MRKLVIRSVLAVTSAGALAFAGCQGPPGESYRRPVDQSQAAARGAQTSHDELPATGGSGGAGGRSDPGQIQTGPQQPLGIPQTGGQQGQQTQQPGAQSDTVVQGQGTPAPGFTGNPAPQQ